MSIGYSSSPGGGGGGSGTGFPLADNVSGVLGTTAPSSISAQVNGVVNRTVLSSNNTTHLLVISDEANVAYDFLGGNPGFIDPSILLTSHNQAKNEFSLIQLNSSNKTLDINLASGDDLFGFGTPRNAKGIGFNLSAGNGGSLGQAPGGFTFTAGDGKFGDQDGGSFTFNFGAGIGTGVTGSFKSSSGDFPFNLSANKFIKILSGSNPSYFTNFGNDGTDSIYSNSLGGHKFIIHSNLTPAFYITDGGGNRFVLVSTTTGTESISFGNSGLNPSYNFLGTGISTFNGNVAVGAAGKGLQVKEGSNAKMGKSTLVGGTVTVANTSVTANSRIFLTSQNTSGTLGALAVTARVAGTSFTITSLSAIDTSDVAWLILEPA